MNNVLSENKLYYDEKEKCLKMFHWRAVKGNSYYYIDSDSMEVLAATEMDSEEDACGTETSTISRQGK